MELNQAIDRLAALGGARLLRAWRRQCHANYATDVVGLGRLFAYLTEDYRNKRSMICGAPAANAAMGANPGEDKR